MKEDKTTRAIPVLALTAHALRGDRDRAIRAGCDDYDTKPVELTRLLAKIERLLRSGAPGGNDLSDQPESGGGEHNAAS